MKTVRSDAFICKMTVQGKKYNVFLNDNSENDNGKRIGNLLPGYALKDHEFIFSEARKQ